MIVQCSWAGGLCVAGPVLVDLVAFVVEADVALVSVVAVVVETVLALVPVLVAALAGVS